MHPAQTKVLSMGRRWGKTVLGGALCGNTLRQHGRVAWIAPTYKNTRPLWRWLVQATSEDVNAKRMSVNKSERSIETKRGGFLGIYSGDNIDSIRGESFHLAVIDEAARIPETAWADAIMPTLADFDGSAILISTPKGKNWFWQEWVRGQAQGRDVASWQAPTNQNPSPQIRKAFEKARDRVTEQSFRQEWMAEFLEGGEVFRRIREAATATAQDARIDGHEYVIGVDLGKLNDFTVFTVIDTGTNEVVYVDRFNQIDYLVQATRLQALNSRFQPYTIIVEQNNVGVPFIEMLYRLNLPVQPFTTTNATKTQAIDALALAFERGEIRIPNDAVLIAELQAYEMERLPSGLMRYSAPAGMHDDTVMSLALAWQGRGESGNLLLFGG
jgi:phage terminase large subunit-like protein